MHSAFRYIKNNLSFVTLLLIMAIMIIVVAINNRWNERDRVIESDTIHYYGYLPSTFIYKDLNLEFTSNDERYFSNKIWYTKAANGKKVFKVSMGVSICYLPFFLMAHGYALLSGAEASGFSTPYKFALVWSSVFFAFIGFVYLRKTLRIWFNEILVSIVLFLCAFGTNLFCYISWEGTVSHAYSFAILTIFLWNTIQWHQKPSYKSSIIIGLLAGWIFLIRPVNLLIIIIFLGWGISNISSIKSQIQKFIAHWKKLILIGFFAFVFCIPQLLYWKIYSGDWLFYSYVGERFYFSHPYILEGLFSWRKGWLLYTPVMSLSLVGIFFLRKRVLDISWVYPIFILILLYITWSWWCWWYGGSFGQRALVDWYGLMAIPIACLLEKYFPKKIIFGSICFFIGACILLNILQDKQHQNTSVHFDSMTRNGYFYRFFTISKHPGLGPLLKAPDYDKARRGEKEYYWE